MIDIEHYSTYYSLDKLLNQIENQNLDVNSLQELSNNELFQIAIDKGFDDFAEYLYIYCGVEYEQNQLINLLQIKIYENNVDNMEVGIVSGGKIGLNIEYLSNIESGKQRIIGRLLSLRKYSIMRYENKGFYYKYNIKYL